MAKEILNLEVKSNIKSVTKDSEDLAKNLGKSSDETKDLGTGLETAGKKGKKGFKGIGTAIKGMGVALKAAGIGIIIGLIAKLMEVFSSNQKVVDFFSTTMTALSIAFNDMFSYLDENYEVIKGYLKGLFTDPLGELAKLAMGIEQFFITKMKGLVLVLEGAHLIMQSFGDPKKYLEGVAKMSAGTVVAGKEIEKIYEEIISSVSDYASGVLEQAEATTKATNASKLAEAQIQGLIEKYDRQAELQRQIRDDERLTFAERKAANDEIAKILDKQEKEMMSLANTRVAAAALELSVNKTNIDLQVAYQQTLNDRAGVEAQVAGFRSEQIVNEASLEKELAEVKKEIAQDSIDGIDRELLELENAYNLKLEMARKANVSDLELTEQYEKDKKAIEDAAAQNSIDVVKATTKAKLDAQLAFGKASANAIGALGSLAKEGSDASKALALTEIAVNTGVGIIQGLDIAQKSAKAMGPGAVYAFPVFFATQLVAVLSAAAKAKAAFGASGGGGGGGGGGAAAAPPAPQMMSGAFQLEGGQEVEPVQAYVVSDDITDSQNGLAIIRRRATI